MKAFRVFVDYQTLIGNPATANIKIYATCCDDAISKGISRVKGYKNCAKVHGGSVDAFTRMVENTLQPTTDWEIEDGRITELREKAIAYIAQMIDKHDSIELLNPIREAESFGTTWGKDAAVSVCLDTDGLFLHESGYPGKNQMVCYFGDSTVIRIAAEVQKAIAGGTGK